MTIAEKKRYYIHGDRYEIDQNRYYCAKCDMFCEGSHFDRHTLDENLARLSVESKNVKKHLKASKTYFRPDSPESYFE